MSDSEMTLPPLDARIAVALRSAVATLFTNNDLENLTVKRVRKSVEQALSLSEDYLKTDSKWSEKSKEIITAESEAQEAAREAAPSSAPQESSPRKATPKKPAQKPKAKPAAPAPKKAAKRQKDTKAKPRKRRKTATSSDEDLSADSDSDSAIETPKKKSPPKPPPSQKPGRKSRALPESDDEDEDDKEVKKSKSISPAKQPSRPVKASPPPKASDRNDEVKGEDSDSSEMSVVIDEPPKPKKKRQKKSASEKPAKEPKAKAKAAKAEKDVSPDEAEIKRLQGWLLKCGIRRLWGKELAAYDTPKAKISHLRQLLKEVGMDGRYSVEKARQIKEQRELAADLAEVQAGAKRWGQEEESDEAADAARPRRRLAKGLQELQFLDSGDEDSG